MTRELLKKLTDFLLDFEQVFDNDWFHTQACLSDDFQKHFIKNDSSSTFLHPHVNDESNDWGNRGRLLASYRALCTELVALPCPEDSALCNRVHRTFEKSDGAWAEGRSWVKEHARGESR